MLKFIAEVRHYYLRYFWTQLHDYPCDTGSMVEQLLITLNDALQVSVVFDCDGNHHAQTRWDIDLVFERVQRT